MGDTQKLNSYANIKQLSQADIGQPKISTTDHEEQTSSAGQTIIVISSFSIDTNNTQGFKLFYDGKLQRFGALNDYIFINIASSGFASQIQMNTPMVASKNIIIINDKQVKQLTPDNTALQSQITSLKTTVPTITRLTSGSGVYTVPAGVVYLRIRMVGGGGSGSGSSAGSGSTGGTTTFGTSLLTANGGSGASGVSGGAGGAPAINSPAITVVAVNGASGGYGNTGTFNSGNSSGMIGGTGGESYFGGSGNGTNGIGEDAVTNSGSGGGGGGVGSGGASPTSGGAGGAGAYIEALLTGTLSATYAYSVGTGASAGSGGSGGGAGGSGVIIVEEYYSG